MRRRIIWLVVSCLMVAALLLASCAKTIIDEGKVGVSEEEAAIEQEEEETALIEVEEAATEKEKVKVTEEDEEAAREATEMAAMAQPIEDIEKYRKGDAVLTILDSQGKPCGGVTVNYKQTGHSFLFSVGHKSRKCPLTILDEFKSIGINCLTPHFSWQRIEPKPGQFDWSWIEKLYMPGEMRKLGFTLIGRWLVWFNDKYDNTPDYLLSMNFDEVNEAVYSHSYTTVSHYKDIFEYWQLNEPIAPWSHSNTLGLSNDQWVEICRTFATAVKEADPNTQVQINFACPEGMPDRDYSPRDFAERLISENVNFDIIGLQLYAHGCPDDDNGYPDLECVSEILDSYGTLGRPIMVQEVCIPDIPSPESQAEWLRSFYTLAFSKPEMRGIRWIAATDHEEFISGGGLLTIDYEPKPAYHALEDLIQNWTTTGGAVTDKKGQVSFRGFGGTYEVVVSDPQTGLSKKEEITIEEQKNNLITIMLDQT